MDLKISVDLLPLAAADLREAAAAARWLQKFRTKRRRKMGEHALARAVETGMVVSYWRPFSLSKTYGKLPSTYVKPDRRVLHATMRDLRNSLYAHTDDHPNRTPRSQPARTQLMAGQF